MSAGSWFCSILVYMTSRPTSRFGTGFQIERVPTFHTLKFGVAAGERHSASRSNTTQRADRALRRGAEQRLRRAVVRRRAVVAEQGRTESRRPVVLDARADRPRRGQLMTRRAGRREVAEDRVERPGRGDGAAVEAHEVRSSRPARRRTSRHTRERLHCTRLRRRTGRPWPTAGSRSRPRRPRSRSRPPEP